MKRALLALGVACVLVVPTYGAPADSPFESGVPFKVVNAVDAAVLAGLSKHNLQPAPLCSDPVFVRRVYLDVCGTLPTPEQVLAFEQDPRPNKRALLIDELLARPEHADYWAMRWCDVLRVKAEFPINLWPNAVQAYHHWLRDAIWRNRPWDQVVRDLLTSSGSNFRVPPVNFYRAVQARDPGSIAAAVALSLLGTRLEAWPEARRRGMEAFFSRLAYKPTGEWKEEIVQLDPAATAPVSAIFPDGTTVEIPAGHDPRLVFADWLLGPGNSWLARSLANRTWAWFFGWGIVHEPDDIRPDNPPSNPELLATLEKALVQSRWDMRELHRLILNSATYQQSSIPRRQGPEAVRLFACYPVRRLEAEVLADALRDIGGAPLESYSSAVPEPFTFIPPYERTIAIADGSITSPFLEMFGRPARDTGLFSERNNDPSDAQRLHLLNSTQVRRQLEQSRPLLALAQRARGNPGAVLEGIYLRILSRHPTPAEVATATHYAQTSGLGPKQVMDDLVWALVNSKEFLYRH